MQSFRLGARHLCGNEAVREEITRCSIRELSNAGPYRRNPSSNRKAVQLSQLLTLYGVAGERISTIVDSVLIDVFRSHGLGREEREQHQALLSTAVSG
ncbi:hypothetical protein VSX64_23510 [Aurantimonas sp. C2-6-R+9]|uniref:hypothetical protein n=1 Tax=unclassified Aurantimonas TaxID=2638230 RepID=UPI002E178F76|nr:MULTISPECIES: hypothetical protein [unclassified Aurantimonas]MEC5293537.1 hypothetical protein [Aurantimonas sp. C2-3-R2]MEC5383719.1 hypothetical protein [Aurantimonas sp. C2-6-R+9]MEC5414611.1 hypothetical protein [Aurantimonas sp. C2-4-R8]